MKQALMMVLLVLVFGCTACPDPSCPVVNKAQIVPVETAVVTPVEQGYQPNCEDVPSFNFWAFQSKAQAAVKKGYRCELLKNWSPDQELCSLAVMTFDQQVEYHKLLIMAEDGSYTDLVLLELGALVNTYHDAIKKANNDIERAKLWQRELSDLQECFITLDQQIKSYHEFEAKALVAFNRYLKQPVNYQPKDDDWDQWKQFQAKNPQYQDPWPGFFSTQVESQRGDRSYDNYHQVELAQIKQLLKHTPITMSWADYENFLRAMDNRLGSIMP